jgi:hypothetical protein
MKETKTYHAPEHKNHQQLLKKCTLPCDIYSTEDFINQWEFLEIRYAKHYWLYALKFMEILLRKKVELNGLYMLLSVCLGIEECRFINLTSDEGYSSHLKDCSSKRRRNCYRIDEEQMNVEITVVVQIFMIF